MKKGFFLVLVTVFFLAGVSHADNFKLDSTGYINGSNVSLQFPNGPGDTLAAFYKVIFNGTDYFGYCVDWATVFWDQQYTDFFMIPVPDQPRYRAAAWLFDQYGANSPTWGVNVQLAMWETIFDYDKTSHLVTPYDGDFYILMDPAASRYGAGTSNPGLIQQYVDDARGHSDFDASSYRLLVSPDTQDYYGVNKQDFMVKTPEPGTLVLLGAGLMAFILIARRKRKA